MQKKRARESIRVVIGALTHKKPDWDRSQSIREVHFQKTGLRKVSARIIHFSLERHCAIGGGTRTRGPKLSSSEETELDSLKVAGTWWRFISPRAEQPRRFLVQLASTYGEWLLKIDLPHGDERRRWLKCLRWNFSANNPQNAFQRLFSHLLTFSSLHWG